MEISFRTSGGHCDNKQDRDIIAMDEKEMPELKGENKVIIADKPTKAMVDIKDQSQELLTSNSVNFWLHLPDVAFNALMMTHSTTQLRILSQVSSSLRKRIKENILENPANMKILRERIERTFIGPGMLPSSEEEITNAIWAGKIKQ